MVKNNGYKISGLTAIVQRMVSDAGTNVNRQKFAEIGGRLLASATALRDLDATPDPTVGESIHVTRVSTAAKRLSTQISNLEAEALSLVKDAQADIDERINAKVNLTADPGFASEIRQLMRSLPYGKQIEMLSKWAKENDASSMAAVLNCPAMLCDIPADIKARFKSEIVLLNAPSEVAERKALLASLEPVLIATRDAKSYVGDFGDVGSSCSPDKLAAIARDRESALAAIASFEAAVPPAAVAA